MENGAGGRGEMKLILSFNSLSVVNSYVSFMGEEKSWKVASLGSKEELGCDQIKL